MIASSVSLPFSVFNAHKTLRSFNKGNQSYSMKFIQTEDQLLFTLSMRMKLIIMFLHFILPNSFILSALFPEVVFLMLYSLYLLASLVIYEVLLLAQIDETTADALP